MDAYANQFKRALGEGRTLFGAWLISGAPSTAEALGVAGFDFLVVDMEHTPLETHHMIDLLRAIAGTPASAVVRMPWNDMVMIKRALDGGAQSVLHAVRAERRRGEARGRVHAISARTASAAWRDAPRQPLRRRCPNYFKSARRRALRDGADRDDGRARALPEIAAVPGVDSHLHRARRPVRVDGPSGRHRQRRRAGHVAHGAQLCRQLGKPVRHHRRQSRPRRQVRRLRLQRGSPSAPTWRSCSSRGQEWLAKAREPRAAASRRRHARGVLMASPFALRPRHQGQPRRMPGLVGARQGAVLGRHQRAVAQSLRSRDRPQHRDADARIDRLLRAARAPAASSSRCAAASGSRARDGTLDRKIVAAPYDPAHHRFNDGRCDPAGPLLRGLR